METEICEQCGKNPGRLISRYFLSNDSDEVGEWVCQECEDKADSYKYEDGAASDYSFNTATL